MNQKENISEYFTKVLTLTKQTKVNGDKIEDLAIVEKILRTLPLRINYKVVAIEESKDLESMNFAKQQSSLEAKEQRLNGQNL